MARESNSIFIADGDHAIGEPHGAVVGTARHESQAYSPPSEIITARPHATEGCMRCNFNRRPFSFMALILATLTVFSIGERTVARAEGGVLGILPGLVGTLQATEVVKLILGIGDLLVGRLLLVDVLSTTFRTLTVRKDESCPVCGIHPTVTSLIDYEEFCGIPASGDVSSDDSSVPEMTVWELKARRDLGDTPFVLDVRKPFEAEIANLGADQLIPVEELFDRLDEIHAARDWEIVVHCRTGGRSAKAVNILLENGFGRAVNLKGGIRAWSEDIDATVLKY